MNSLPWVRLLFHRLHGAQQKTLSFFIDALLGSQDVRLAEIAREAAKQNEGKVRYTLKRLWRFLHNPRFNDDFVTRGLAEWVWPHFRSWKHVPISIDWTHNEKRDKWATLAAFVTVNGRGIPLMMWSYRKAEYDEHLSRNRCEEAFIKHLVSILPEDDRIVIMADRGFARSGLFKWLMERHIHFIIRVPRHVYVKSSRYAGMLSRLPVTNGQCYSLGAIGYKKNGELTLPQLIVAREQQSDQNPDPWFLATSLNCRANTVAKLYARRMIIEQDFREAKSRLAWSDSRIRTLHHYRRLTTIIMIVLAFAMFVGRIAHRRPTLAEQVARRRKGRWDQGYTALGLALLRRSLKHLCLLHQIKLPAQPI